MNSKFVNKKEASGSFKDFFIFLNQLEKEMILINLDKVQKKNSYLLDFKEKTINAVKQIIKDDSELNKKYYKNAVAILYKIELTDIKKQKHFKKNCQKH